VICYASRTGTRRNLDAMRARGWRLLISATGCHRSEGMPYAIDNGAWTAHQRGEPWKPEPFLSLLSTHGRGADWTVCPDIVGGGRASLALSLEWLPVVLSVCPVALVAVQDGLEAGDVAHLLGPRVGIFVGGTTEWKLATLEKWARLCRERGAWCHVGRVNSVRRINLCTSSGVTSADGTSVSRYATTIGPLDSAARQERLAW